MKKFEFLTLFSLVSLSFFLFCSSSYAKAKIGSDFESWIPPQQEDVAYLKARNALEKQEWESASKQFRFLLETNPKSMSAILGLSQSLLSERKRDEAVALLLKASQQVNSKQRILVLQRLKMTARLFLTNRVFEIYQEGLNLLMAKKFRNARERFERALIEEPDNTFILVRLGEVLVLDNEAGDAIPKLDLAKKINPYDPLVNLWLGRALQAQGRHKEALPELRDAALGLKGSELAVISLAEELAFQSQASAAIRLLESDSKTWPFHLWGLTTLVKLRLQSSRMDARELWGAQKELQLALSRFNSSNQPSFLQMESDFGIQLLKSPSDIKNDIQRLMQQVQSRLSVRT